MHIEIDDAVYTELGRRVQGFEQPNDVLRRLLGLPASSGGTPPEIGRAAVGRPGKLVPLLTAGVLKAGDTVIHVQARKGRRFTATVQQDGTLTTERGRYVSPSPALKDLVGTQIDGWAFWTHESSGRSLRQLRADAGGRPRGQSA